MGKSRLIAELGARAVSRGMTVLVGECLALGEGELPYAPVVGALRSLVDQRGAAEIDALLPSGNELAALMPELGAEPDAPALTPAGSQARLFEQPYDENARLVGEHLYEDKTSLQIEEVDPAEAITPARVREIHRKQLAELESERGDRFWVLGVGV
jgi:hypothetical protein